MRLLNSQQMDIIVKLDETTPMILYYILGDFHDVHKCDYILYSFFESDGICFSFFMA